MPPLVNELQSWALAAFRAAPEETLFDVVLNQVQMIVPGGTLMTMVHCLYLEDDKFHLLVENAHLEWMIDKLSAGDTFLDVGAATGATSLPIGMRRNGVDIIAFEPASRAGRLLRLAASANGLSLNVVQAAISDMDGVVWFDELPYDPARIPFQTETSHIAADTNQTLGSLRQLPTVRLDSYDFRGKNIVAKVDVEGAEVAVLNGARQTIGANRIFFSIDIHGNTEEGCREILEPFSYTFERLGHVLLCTPGAERS